jgi:hypothetical protein
MEADLEAVEARLADLLGGALAAFAHALKRGRRATRRDCDQIRVFWAFWEDLAPVRQQQLRARPPRFRYALAPADIAALFGRLDGEVGGSEAAAASLAAEPPLTKAVSEGHLWLVRDYLVAGADPDRPDSHGTTALMYACYDRSDTKMASLLCVAGGGGSTEQINSRGETAEMLTRKYAVRSHQPQLLRILSIAGRLSHEQLLAFGAGYHPQLGENSAICEHLYSDVMDRVVTAMPQAWRSQSLAHRARVWQRFGGPGSLDEGISPWLRHVSALGYSEGMLARLCGGVDEAELEPAVEASLAPEWPEGC